MNRANRIMGPEPLTDLSLDFLGLRLENPFILSAAPSTDDLDMTRAGLSAGWAGAGTIDQGFAVWPVGAAYG